MVTGSTIKHYWTQWVKQRALTTHPQRLDRHNLYILPSKLGLIFALILMSIFLSAINYQVSMVFFFTFLLAIAGLISAWEAHDNLQGIQVECLAVEDAYQSHLIKVVLQITPSKLCYAIEYYFPDEPHLKLEKMTRDGTTLVLWLMTDERGYFQLPRMTICSYFPLGLFRVWGYIYLNTHYYVYPKATSPGFWPTHQEIFEGAVLETHGHDELYELKSIPNPFIQPSRIAWKIAARGQGWYLKTMQSPQGNCWMFRIDSLPTHNIEENLQYLSYWLQTAEAQGDIYGVELKGVQTTLASGPSHLKHCLRQLAIY